MGRRVTVLADTHALLWWIGESPRLSSTARKKLDGAKRVMVSAITGWEVAMLVDAGRVKLDRPVHVWFRDLFARDDVAEVPLGTATAVSAGLLDIKAESLDPADRIIYASAAELRVPLVSKDRDLHDLAKARSDVQLIW